jgi:peptidoglycan/LPS O-acetylase OafA/YrhL
MQRVAPPANTKIFFPHLDGLRFISFFVVFVYHCYLSFYIHLKESNPQAYTIFKTLFQNGYLGVNFFFVLSGFLITFLLIKEKELSGTIHVGNFYMRRILRIWPLFYVCILIGFVLHPLSKILGHETVVEPAHVTYYLGFIANFDYINIFPLRPNGVVLPVLWSVCVEEQFYLAWPLILSIVPLRYWKYVFFFIIGGSLVFRSLHTGCSDQIQSVRYFHTFSLIGDMALGGCLAYYCSYENPFKKFITNIPRAAIIAVYIVGIPICLFRGSIFPCGIPIIFERFVIGIFFGFIILEQNYATHSFIKMGRFRRVSKLGVYTYGLYCLHLLAITFMYKLVGKVPGGLTPGLSIVASIAGLALSILIAWASYTYFEKKFLRIKARFG